MNTLAVKRDRNIVKAKLKHRRAKKKAATRASMKPKSGNSDGQIPQLPRPPLRLPPKKLTGRRYQCLVCGRKYRSLIELRAHKQMYLGPHVRPTIQVPESAGTVKIGSTRRRGYRGHRATTRSS